MLSHLQYLQNKKDNLLAKKAGLDAQLISLDQEIESETELEAQGTPTIPQTFQDRFAHRDRDKLYRYAMQRSQEIKDRIEAGGEDDYRD